MRRWVKGIETDRKFCFDNTRLGLCGTNFIGSGISLFFGPGSRDQTSPAYLYTRRKCQPSTLAECWRFLQHIFTAVTTDENNLFWIIIIDPIIEVILTQKMTCTPKWMNVLVYMIRWIIKYQFTDQVIN
jgi:hypothetical protein